MRLNSTCLIILLATVLSLIPVCVMAAPSDISLSSTSVLEKKVPGTTVGTFSTTDDGYGGGFTYKLVSGTGGDNNSSFSISGATLKTAVRFDYKNGSSYTIRVRTTESSAPGSTFDKVFIISIINVNDPPTLNSIPTQTCQMNAGPQSVPLSGIAPGDSVDIANGQTVTITATSDNPGLVPNPTINYSNPDTTGTLVYQPVAFQTGTAHITVTVKDNGGTDNGAIDTLTRTFSIDVQYTNAAPTINAVPDQVMNENSGPQSIPLTGIGPGGNGEESWQTLTVSASVDNTTLIPAVSVNYAGGSTATVNYQPTMGQFGTAVLTVTVQDNGGSVSGGTDMTTSLPINIIVNQVVMNAAPTIVPLSDVTVDENSGAYTVNLLGIGPGNDGESAQVVTITAASNNTGLIPNPTVNYTNPNPTGTLIFTPVSHRSGSAVITVTVKDNGGTANGGIDTTTVQFTVTVRSLNNVTVNEDSGPYTMGLTDIGSSGSGQVISVTATSGNTALIPNPTVTYTSPSTTGTLVFTPNPDRFGSAAITVTAHDSTSVDTTLKVFTVTVLPVNDPPTIDAIPTQSPIQDTGTHTVTLTGIGPGGFGEDAQTVTITAISARPDILPDPVVNYSGGSTATLVYTPNFHQSGPVDVTVILQDDGGTENGGVDKTTVVFTINILMVNDPPLIDQVANLSLPINASKQTVNLTGISPGDEDDLDQNLVITAKSNNTTVIPNPTVTYKNGDPTGSIAFTPVAGQSGHAVITVTLQDDGGTALGGVDTTNMSFVVAVTDTNDPPTIDPIADQSVPKNSAGFDVTLTGLTPGDADDVLQTLTISAVSNNHALLPDPTVTFVNPSDYLTPKTAKLTLIPVANQTGPATITVTVKDNAGGTDTTMRSFTATISGQNHAPTIDPIANQTVNENASAQTVNLTGISAGDPGQTVTITATSDNPALIPNPAVSYTNPNATGTLTYTPTVNQSGTAHITVTVQDNGGTDGGGVDTATQAFTITVRFVNTAPTLNDIANLTIDENAGVQTVNLAGISAGDADDAGQTITITAASNNTSLIPNPAVTYTSPQATGSLAFTPVTNASGTATITVTVKDNGGTANGGVDTTVKSFTVTVNFVNTAPTLNAIADVALSENAGLQTVNLSGISAGDADDAGQTISVTASSSNPTLIPTPAVTYTSPQATGTLTFTPAANKSGTSTITVTVQDNGGTAHNGIDTCTRSFTVTVNFINAAPTIDNILDQTVNENSGAHTINLTGISSGDTGQNITVTATSNNTALIPNPVVSYTSPQTTGTLTFAPNSNQTGTATITVTVKDDGGTANGGVDTTVKTFKVTVNFVNNAPTINAIPDQTMYENDAPLAVNLAGISAGDAGQTINITATSGNAALLPDPAVTYTSPNATGTLTLAPNADRFGTALVTVTVKDNGGTANGGVDTAVQTFTLTVKIVNKPPTIDQQTDVDVLENAAPTAITLTGIGPGGNGEESGQTLTITAQSDTPAIIPDPVVTYTGGSTAQLVFQTLPYQIGTAAITVTVQDNGGTDHGGADTTTMLFNINVTPVNYAPTIDPIADQHCLENAGAQAVNLTGIGPGGMGEEDWQTVTLSAVSDNHTLIPDPSVDYPGFGATATLTYTPNADQIGTAHITVTASDDGGTAFGGSDTTTVTFKITVNLVNHAPTIDAIGDQTINENADTQTVNLTGISASDPGQVITITAVSNNTALIPNPTITYTSPNATGTLAYTPAATHSGQATITVTVKDDGGTANGGIDTTITTFKVTVNFVNTAPTLNPIPDQSVNENAGAQAVTLTGISAGDADDAGQVITITATSDNPALIPNPTITYTSPNATGTLTYQPVANQIGAATVTVTVKDNGGTANGGVDTTVKTFNIVVTVVNHAPAIDPIADQTAFENAGPQTVNLTGISANDAGQTIAITATSGNTAVIPNPAITYTSPSATGTLTYQPVVEAIGTALITVTVKDNGGTANGGVDTIVKTFTITVNAVNDAPTLNAIADATLNENAGPQTVNLTGISAGDADDAGQTITITATSSNPALIPNPVVSYTSPAATGTLTYTPVANASGTATITVTVKDNGGTANGGVDTTVKTFTVTVNFVNTAPTLDAIAAQTMTENDGPLAVNLTGISAGDAGQAITVTAVSSNKALLPDPAVNYISPSATGSLTLAPAADHFGTATVTVTAQDNGGTANGGVDTVTRTFTVTVNLINEPPTIDQQPDVEVMEDSASTSITLTGIAPGDTSEENGQTLAITAQSDTPAIVPDPVVTYTGGSTAQLTFGPLPYEVGTATITVTVKDDGGTANGGNDTTTMLFNVNVTPVNDPPTIDPIADQTCQENDGPQTVDITGIGPGGHGEEDWQMVIVTATSDNPTLVPNPTLDFYPQDGYAELTYAPQYEQHGVAHITVTVQDDGGTGSGSGCRPGNSAGSTINGHSTSSNGGIDTTVVTFTVTVNAVPDGPPTILHIDDQTLMENGAPLALTVNGGQPIVTPFDNDDVLTVNTTTNGIVTAQFNNDYTVLTVTPVAEAHGIDPVTISAFGTDDDGQGPTATMTFNVTVIAVPDGPPAIASIADQTLYENDPAQALTVTVTPFDADDVLAVNANSDHPEIVQAAIAGTTLTLTPQHEVVGQATITVTAQGTDDDGAGPVASVSFKATVVAVNDTPTLDPIANQAIPANTGAKTINLTGISAGDADDAGQTITITATSDNPALIPDPVITYTSPNATATLTATPADGQVGTAKITVTAKDDGGIAHGGVDTLVRTFTLSVVTANDPPHIDAIPDQTIDENAGPQTVNLTGISGGAIGQVTSVTATSDNPALIPNPTVAYTSGATGTLTYTPATNAIGTAKITITVKDDGGTANGGIDTTTAAFKVTVNFVNTAPTIDQYPDFDVFEDSAPTTITLTGICAGDADDAGQTLTVTAQSDTPAIIPDPIITYTGGSTATLTLQPLPYQYGTVMITVTVQDDGGTANGGVDTTVMLFNVNVDVVNDAPVINAIPDQTILENAGAQTVNLTGIGPGGMGEEDWQQLTVTASSDNKALIPDPTVNYLFGDTGTLVYTPAANASGTANITITVQDDGGTADGGIDTTNLTFKVTVLFVNTAPTLDPLTDITILENAGPQTVNLTGISAGDVEDAGQTLTITASSDNPALIPNPAVTYTSPNPTGTLAFTPVANTSGTANITVTVKDNGGTANGGVDTTTRAFKVTVLFVNTAPTLDPIADQMVFINAGKQTVNLTGISAGDADDAGQTLTITASSDNPALIPDPTVNYAGGTTGTLDYTPVTDQFGVAHITVTVKDNGGTANGGVDTTTRTFKVTVRGANEAPTIDQLPDQTVLENAPATAVTLTGLSAGPDDGWQTLTITALSDTPIIVPDPTITYTGGSTAMLVFQPGHDQVGSVTITVTVQDDGGTAFGGIDTTTMNFNINVDPVNHQPTIDPIADQTVLEDAAMKTVPLTGIGPGGSGEEDWQQITITAVSDNPTLIPDPTVAYTAGATGTLSYTPVHDKFGTAHITVTVQDDGGTTNGGIDTITQSFAINVLSVNDAPTIDPIADQTVKEDSGAHTLQLTGIGPGGSGEENGQIVTVTATSDNTALQPNPTVDYTGGATGTLTFTPATAHSGMATITVKVKDNGGTQNGGVDTTTTTFKVTVLYVNTAPTIDQLADQDVLEDSGNHTVTLTGITPGDADDAGQVLDISALSDTPQLIPDPVVTYSNPNTTATLTFHPMPAQVGTANITVTVHDNGGTANGGSDTTVMTFDISVTPVNDPPTIDPIADQTVLENSGPHTVGLTGIGPGGVDEEAWQTVTVTATSDNPTLIADPTVLYNNGDTKGTLIFTPLMNQTGTAHISVIVHDDGGTLFGGIDTTIRTFAVNVLGVNTAPTLDPIADQTSYENAGPTQVSLTGISAGEAGQIVTITVASDNPAVVPNPTVAYTNPNATGTLTFQPVHEATGLAVITVTVQDNGGTANGGVDTISRKFVITVLPVNDAPTLDPISDLTVLENSKTHTIALTGISAGDADDAGQALTVSVTSDNPLFDPTLTVTYSSPNPTGVLTFSLQPETVGVANVTVTVKDDGGTANGGVDSISRTFKLTVLAVNDPPTIDDIADQTMNEDDPALTLNLTGISSGDADDAAQAIGITVTSDNTAVVPIPVVTYTSPNATGTLTITPAANAFGTATITVTVKDNGGTANGGVDTTVKTFKVTVLSVNDAPTIDQVADMTILEDAGTQTVNLTGISAGGKGTESGQTLTVTASSNNTALIPTPTVTYTSPNTTGTLTFTPVANANGVATITVTVKDNGGTANGGVDTTTMTFKVTVTAVNDPPTINTISDQTVLEDAPAQAVSLSGISAGAEGSTQTVTVTATSDNTALIPNPTVSYTNPNATGTLTYQPIHDKFGVATITVVVKDNGGTADGGVDTVSKTFKITVLSVNDAPTLAALNDMTLNEDAGVQTVQLKNIGPGGSGEESSQLLTVTASSNNTALIPTPTVTYANPDTTGTLTFASAAGKSGVAVITVTVKDDGGTANGGVDTTVKTFTVTVLSVNDAPTIDNIPNQQVLENADAQTLTLTGIGPGGDGEESAQLLTMTVKSSNTTLIPDPTLAFGGGNTATLTYQPANENTGVATITVTVKDNGGTANGGVDTTVKTFTITVVPVNDPPTINQIADQVVKENCGPQTLTLSGISAGDADDAGQKLTFTPKSNNPSLIPDPTVNYTGGTTGKLTFTPATDKVGTAKITLTIKDDGGTDNGGVDTTTVAFNITVLLINHAPTIDPIADQTVNENSGLTGHNPPDNMSSPPYQVALTGIGPGGNGEDDGQQLTVTASSSDPLLIPDPQIVYLSPQPKGTLAFTPAADESGVATITVTVKDDGGTANGGVDTKSVQFRIAVNFVNTAPTIDPIGSKTVLENCGVQDVTLTGISAGNADDEGQKLTITASSNDTTIIQEPTVDYYGGPTAVLHYQPVADTYGSGTITVTVTDDGGTANGGVDTCCTTFTINVRSVNTAPTIDKVADQTILENAGVQTVDLTGIGPGGAGEQSWQTVTVGAVTDNTALIQNLSVDPTSDTTCTLTYQPAPSLYGVATIIVTVQDDGGTANNGIDTTIMQFKVKVVAVNDAPTIDQVADQFFTVDSGAQTVQLTGIGPGGNGEESWQTLTVTATSSDTTIMSQPKVTYTGGTTGTLTCTPIINKTGAVKVTVTVKDNGGTANGGVDTTTMQFNVQVAMINDPPTINAISNLTMKENDPAKVITLSGISAGDADDKGQVITITAASDNPALIPNPVVTYTSDSTTGKLTIAPKANAYGTAHVTVTVKDNGGTAYSGVDTTVKTFTVTVQMVNNAPTMNPIADITLADPTGTKTVILTGIGPGGKGEEDWQTLTITAKSDTPGLIPDPVITGVGTTRTLSYTPVPKVSGKAKITVTVKDNGGTANGGVDTTVRTFTITVSNHQPDLWVRYDGDKPFIGNAIYNQDGTGQTRTVTSDADDTTTFYFAVQNAGNVKDTFTVKNMANTTGWSVKVYTVNANMTKTGDVTSKFMTSTGWTTGTLNAGQIVYLRVDMSWAGPASAQKTCAVALQAISQANAQKQDVAKAVTNLHLGPDLWIKGPTDTMVIGDDIFNADGTNQVSTQKTTANKSVMYSVTLLNADVSSNPFNLKAPAAPAGWKVKYLVLGLNRDITTQVTSSIGWTSTALPAQTGLNLQVIVTPDATVRKGATLTLPLNAISINNPSQVDCVVTKTIKQ